jgi:hypothetical protein
MRRSYFPDWLISPTASVFQNPNFNHPDASPRVLVHRTERLMPADRLSQLKLVLSVAHDRGNRPLLDSRIERRLRKEPGRSWNDLHAD